MTDSSLYIGAIGTGFAPGYISHANPFLLLENSSATYSPHSGAFSLHEQNTRMRGNCTIYYCLEQ
jgi:hypothetical protein